MNTEDKLIIEAIRNSDMANEVFKTDESTKFIFAAAQNTAGCPVGLDGLSYLRSEAKNRIIDVLCARGALTQCPTYRGIIPHTFKFIETPIKKTCRFPNRGEEKFAKFSVPIPLENISTFNGPQFLRLRTKPPKLAAGAYDPEDVRVKYRYTAKPGIRAIKELSWTSSGIPVETYSQLDVLRYDVEGVPDNLWEPWNEAIGHDLGQDATLYNQFLDSESTIRVKVGNQTPTHVKPGLDLLIPVLFDFNKTFESKLNNTAFLSNTLQIEGILEHTNMMVTAEFYDDDVTIPPVTLACEPLEIEDFTLVTTTFMVDDPLHAVMSGKNQSVFVRYWTSHIYPVEKDPCDPIELKGNSNTEAYTVCARPKSYCSDFDKWIYLTEVDKICTPTACMTPSAPGVFNRVSVKPSVSYVEKESLETIGLGGGEGNFMFKPILPVKYYSILEQVRVARNHPRFRPRYKEMYKLNFDYFYLDNVLTGAMPHGKLKPILYYTFNTEHLDNDAHLLDEWEIIVFRDTFNKRISKDSSAITRHQL